MRWLGPLYDGYRRRFGRYTIEDPRPIAEEAPYTYFLPTENELIALRPGDLVKLVFLSHPAGRDWAAERMWVIVTTVDGEHLTGTLENVPCDMPQLEPGDTVTFRRSDVIDRQWASDRPVAPPPPPVRREYWDRCMVDDCVVQGRSPVHYLYREEPDLAGPDDQYPDSGWRIRGRDDAVAADEAAGLPPRYVALGVVLNRDDRWLSLVDRPTGSRFYRDATGDGFSDGADDDATAR